MTDAPIPTASRLSDIGGDARLWTIPPHLPFLRTLAAALQDGRLSAGAPPSDMSSPFAISNATILVPTLRAARALQDAFLDVAPDRALLLPEIRPISEGDEDQSLIAAFAA
ncbi:MAG: hypothetical protein AAFR55_04670, partial [Pseudomonadota bacterium]